MGAPFTLPDTLKDLFEKGGESDEIKELADESRGAWNGAALDLVTTAGFHVKRVLDGESHDVLDWSRAFGENILGHGDHLAAVVDAMQASIDAGRQSKVPWNATTPEINAAQAVLLQLIRKAGWETTKMTMNSSGSRAIENLLRIAHASFNEERHAEIPDGESHMEIVLLEGAFHGSGFVNQIGGIEWYIDPNGMAPARIHRIKAKETEEGLDYREGFEAFKASGARDEKKKLVFMTEGGVLGVGGGRKIRPEGIHSIVEEIQGEGGLWLVDAVQTSHRRPMSEDHPENVFVSEGFTTATHKPDLTALSKGWAGGRGAAFSAYTDVVYKRAQRARSLRGGNDTFAKDPLGAAAMIATVGTLRDPEVQANMRRQIERLHRELNGLLDQNTAGARRKLDGDGLMLGIGFDSPELLQQALAVCTQVGLIVASGGIGQKDHMRLLVPVDATDAIIEEGLAKLKKVLKVSDTHETPGGPESAPE